MDLFNRKQNFKVVFKEILNILTQMEIKLLNLTDLNGLVKKYFFMETDLLRKESNAVNTVDIRLKAIIILIPKENKLVKEKVIRVDMIGFFTMMDLFNTMSIIKKTQSILKSILKPIMIKMEIYCILS